MFWEDRNGLWKDRADVGRQQWSLEFWEGRSGLWKAGVDVVKKATVCVSVKRVPGLMFWEDRSCLFKASIEEIVFERLCFGKTDMVLGRLGLMSEMVFGRLGLVFGKTEMVCGRLGLMFWEDINGLCEARGCVWRRQTFSLEGWG